MMVDSAPMPCRNPAVSRAIYEAPIRRVFWGKFGSENKSSEVIQYFSPGIPG